MDEKRDPTSDHAKVACIRANKAARDYNYKLQVQQPRSEGTGNNGRQYSEETAVGECHLSASVLPTAPVKESHHYGQILI